jgi:hypothetical protein
LWHTAQAHHATKAPFVFILFFTEAVTELQLTDAPRMMYPLQPTESHQRKIPTATYWLAKIMYPPDLRFNSPDTLDATKGIPDVVAWLTAKRYMYPPELTASPQTMYALQLFETPQMMYRRKCSNRRKWCTFAIDRIAANDVPPQLIESLQNDVLSWLFGLPQMMYRLNWSNCRKRCTTIIYWIVANDVPAAIDWFASALSGTDWFAPNDATTRIVYLP